MLLALMLLIRLALALTALLPTGLFFVPIVVLWTIRHC
jgi:hypothetical protein